MPRSVPPHGAAGSRPTSSSRRSLTRLRAATRVEKSAIAPGRGPRDNDKFIHAFKGQNVDRALARRKKDAERRLEEAERDQVPKPPAPLRLATGLTAAAAGGRVVTVRDLVVVDRLRLPVLDLDSGEHLLVTGANGTGKSTLLGVLAGRVRPASGTVQVIARRVVELTQDPVFPDLTATAADTYAALVGPESAQSRPLRSLGLLPAREHPKPVVLLSVGQRRRLALAIAVATAPDLLLLDEPTNHLSLALVTEPGGGDREQPGHDRGGLARPVAPAPVGRRDAGARLSRSWCATQIPILS
ncbi:ATP-binding cassette domain-containing protein [Nocardioides convexus]|uniref:ATP-binding cassette domain-containing protein n=1 Tax=Nocardioides convexus TaxID=2712224 RepID=UPI002418A454|nr:ATP-binding cassette domain-containing protein [Nocardioides convexus]